MSSPPKNSIAGVVVALAGRRVDAASGAGRFPPALVPTVRKRIRSFLESSATGAVASSAACGADLLALEVAGELGLRRRVVLPFAAERFRETSVVDRGAEWGALYDRILREVTADGDLMVLGISGEEAGAYARVNQSVLDEALALARAGGGKCEVVAAIVWDGAPRGPDDLTAHFAREARSRGIPTVEISTL